MNLKNEVSQEKPIKEHLLEAVISRREFLLASIGLVASGAAVLSSYGKDVDATPVIEKPGEVRNFNQNMLYRRLGRTNLMVSEVSFGGAFHYGPAALKDSAEIQKVFDKSLELGVNYFDTSPDYGTESYFAYLSSKRERYFLATKVNTMSATGARTEVENSLKVMKTDYLDVIQTHYKPQQNEDWNGVLEALRELHKLKSEGKVRFVGFTHHSYDALKIALNEHSDLIDTILLLYSFHSETDGAVDTIKLAHSKGIGTLAMKVFRSASESWEKRVETFKADATNWARLKVLMDDSTSVAQACIKYVLKNPFLSTALLGMQSVKNVSENAVVPKMMDVGHYKK